MTDHPAEAPKRPARKVHADPDLLTPGDFRRGRVALEGRDPWDMLRGHQEDRAVFIGWALLSRDDPTLTIEDVDGWNFGAYIYADGEGVEDDADRPPEAPSSTNGSGPNRNAAKPNAKQPSGSPSSAVSTT